MDSFAFFVGVFFGVLMAVLVACVSGTFVNRNTLERNGYRVIEHSETHGESRTNWVEVVRTNWRAL